MDNVDGLIGRLRELLANATPGPWMVQDGCSWRRIGTRQHDGDVLRPTNSRTDGHPDLTADDGMCRYNLEAIVETHNALPDLLTTLENLAQENARLRELCDAACSNAETALDFLAKAGRPELAKIQAIYVANLRKSLGGGDE